MFLFREYQYRFKSNVSDIVLLFGSFHSLVVFRAPDPFKLSFTASPIFGNRFGSVQAGCFLVSLSTIPTWLMFSISAGLRSCVALD